MHRSSGARPSITSVPPTLRAVPRMGCRERRQPLAFQPFFFKTLLFRQPLPFLFGPALGFGLLPREFGLALPFGFRRLAGALGSLLGALCGQLLFGEAGRAFGIRRGLGADGRSCAACRGTFRAGSAGRQQQCQNCRRAGTGEN